MDKRIKYNFKQQQSSVRSVLEDHEPVMSVARRLGCSKKTVQRWIKLYLQHGVSGLQLRPGSYTGAFKLKVIRHMLKNRLSISEVAAIFGVPNDSTVGRWFILYEKQGTKGLLEVKRRGRKKLMKSRKIKKSKDKAADAAEQRLAALQAENEYLHAENAFLKKLKALIEEEEAVKARSRQPKPSKD
jgi:transposase